LRIVIDTNVLVAAVLSPYGPPAAILRSVLTGRVTACFDQRILAEYRDVLTRGRLGLDSDRVAAILEDIEANGERVLPAPLRLDLPHPADGMFVEVTAASQAGCIVTGNLRYFPTDRLQGVQVLPPRAFIEEFLGK
jgi:putative PIN family toxin of toxin-antitoxin system